MDVDSSAMPTVPRWYFSTFLTMSMKVPIVMGGLFSGCRSDRLR
jgi:hypothetical protein